MEDEGDYEDYINSLRNGAIIFNVGGFFLALFLFFAGAFRDDLNHFVRLGMLIAAGIIILKLLTLVVSTVSPPVPEIDIELIYGIM